MFSSLVRKKFFSLCDDEILWQSFHKQKANRLATIVFTEQFVLVGWCKIGVPIAAIA